MTCDHPECTGCHDDRQYDRLCPRSKANKNRAAREDYYRHIDKRQASAAVKRTTAAYMLSQIKYEATRRGGNGASTQSD